MRRRTIGAAVAVALSASAVLGACSSGGSTAELCRTVGGGTFAAVFHQGFDPTNTEQALAQLKTAATDLDELHSAAPGSMRGAVRDELSYVQAVTKVLQRVDPDDEAKVVEQINALGKERAAAQAASTKLAAYQQAHCTTTTTAAG